MDQEPSPLNKGAVSDRQREEWEMLRKAGRPLDLEPGPPSRSKLGRFFDFLDRLTKSSQSGNRWP